MESSPTLSVTVIDPDQILFQGQAEAVFAPGRFGMLGILPNHTPMYAELVAGEVLIQGKQEKILAVESGILRVARNELTILLGI